MKIASLAVLALLLLSATLEACGGGEGLFARRRARVAARRGNAAVYMSTTKTRAVVVVPAQAPPVCHGGACPAK